MLRGLLLHAELSTHTYREARQEFYGARHPGLMYTDRHARRPAASHVSFEFGQAGSNDAVRTLPFLTMRRIRTMTVIWTPLQTVTTT